MIVPISCRKRSKAFSLIELTLTILIMSILSVNLLLVFSMTAKGVGAVEQHTIALDLAASRMEVIIGQKALFGFDHFDDPCRLASSPAVCLSHSGYTVSSTISRRWHGDPNAKLVTVTVKSALLAGGITISSVVSDD